jgi:hypothetical protein
MSQEERPEKADQAAQAADPPQDQSRPHVAIIQTVERQVGEHVLSALRQADAVAALTTLVPGVRHDRVVSIPLTSEQVEAIRDVLQVAESEAADAGDDDQGRREGFLGFHTVLRLEDEQDAATDRTDG